MVSDHRLSPWEMLVVDLVRRALWKWPMRASSWAGRQVFDRPLLSLAVVAPVLIAVAASVALWKGIDDQRWGEPIRIAWSNEEVARRNVDLLRRELEQHNRTAPPPAGGEEWREQAASLRRELARQKAFIPSWLWPLAPEQSFPPSQWGWRLFYDVHHFLFRSVYAAVLGLYLLLGIASGWKGSQRWWRRRWRRAIAGSTSEQTLLGLDGNGGAHYLTQEERNRHLLIAGTTGAGKTEALKLLARQDIASGRGLVFIDMKGDRSLAESLFSACVAAGRRDDFLYFTLEAGPSHRYNALASGDALAKRDRIINACTWSAELFYKNEAKAAAGRVLAALATKGAITFDDLYRAFDEREAYAQIARSAAPPDRPKFERDLQGWPQFWRNLSGLRANLHEFLQLRDRLCVPHGDIDFREVHQRNRVVYFELNSQMRKEASSSLAKLLLEDLKHLSGSLAAGPADNRKPFSIYIDEARNAVYDGFVGFISQCRSAGMGLVLATQSPLDFDSEDGGVTLSVTQNTATKLIFCQRDPTSAQFSAELGGTKDALKRTAQVVDDGFLFGPAPTGVYSEREVKEFHVHPDELKSLGVGRAYLLQGDGARAVIRVHHQPNTGTTPLAPTMPRKWHPGDQERLGHNLRPLDLCEIGAPWPVVAGARRGRFPR